jgi:hypothetical protein
MNLTCLPPVGQPAHHTWYSKENREEVERETFSSISACHYFPRWRVTYPSLDILNRYTPQGWGSIQFFHVKGDDELTSYDKK